MNKNGRTKTVSVPGKILASSFPDERGFIVELPNGEILSAVIDQNLVDVQRKPEIGEKLDGRIFVRLIEIEGDSAIIEFPPQSTLNGKARQRVPQEFLIQEG